MSRSIVLMGAMALLFTGCFSSPAESPGTSTGLATATGGLGSTGNANGSSTSSTGAQSTGSTIGTSGTTSSTTATSTSSTGIAASSTSSTTFTSGTSSASSTSGASSTGSSTGGDCLCSQSASIWIDNGDIGASCTGADPDGGSAQGTCPSGEVCLFQHGPGSLANCYLLAGPGCSCPNLACGGGFFGAAWVCIPSCQPAGPACPGGLTCTSWTPSQDGYGTCSAPCRDDADCQAPIEDGGRARTFVCRGGNCVCQTDADCANLQDGFYSCDTQTGVCYAACSGCAATGFCCSEAHGLQYCDYFYGAPTGPGATATAPVCSGP
ncbi:MAG: hypothetical protein JST54_24005 [Deltaproteobacteria bacterium]|nr:hypothetical protein [Deltaproteobacteria bacterium]